ncbi:FAD-binding protein [Novosphingobium sp. ERN07]|uniref:3-oxosteroid 1-dehydrogenase n=1 Tax=Novosphingobium taihuense TaxID=260085 RepID=A0A7W7AEE4_9SPHN|nr:MULTISPECIES: FAD-binding protein [Novosphingobium]MBB4615458.1 3-oxosteroid 1-dehydrogenase [Novosphingobium taihuense]NLR72785.1 FAD-binding protein [Novosphingobium sp. ERN07]TWH82094.1 3-oxosteroid 1-dehydrogenase [Novosphingobium taihuense]
MSQWDETRDFVIVGSGGGSMIAAIAMKDAGKDPLVLEKTDKIGGSTAMSGGVFWIPNHPLQARDGIDDNAEKARTYLDAAVGDVGPGTSRARKDMFLEEGPKMVLYLEQKGMPFVRCDGWSDYHDDLPGGCPESRSLAVEPFAAASLGKEWQGKLRRGLTNVVIRGIEGRQLMLMKRMGVGKLAALKVGLRMAKSKILGQDLVGAGTAIQGRMLKMALDHKVDIRTEAGVADLVEENGRVVGVVSNRNGKPWRIRARDGVLINAGGFSRNAQLRQTYGPQPSSTDWTNANPGDTGEMIELAKGLGAALDCTDGAVWILTSTPPSGDRYMHVLDLPKPHVILVDQQGRRFTNEAQSYMANGQAVYAHGDVPVWAIIESRHRDRYPWSFHAGATPQEWFDSGYMKKAASLEDLARQIEVPAENLKATVERWNVMSRKGKDEDFGRGSKAYDLVFADPTNAYPNPGLGPIEQPPFYAVAIYPGDVGTFGGIVTDEYARALREDGSVIPGLYATGNSTASVMGRTYPGAGASISPAFIFGWVAARHAARQNFA